MLNLRVQHLDRVCLFELSWGQGQRLSKTHIYPELLTSLYQTWQQTYLNFYRNVPISISPASDGALRGKKGGSGTLNPSQQIDWHGAVVEAETHLLREFHRWLRHEELYEIRRCIAQTSPDDRPVNLFLSCTPLDLARLPWETWEIGAEFQAGRRVRVIRTPTNVRGEPALSARRLRSRPRILAILGDSTGLNFQADREAIKSLARLAHVEFVGWQPGKTVEVVRAEIGQAIADPTGWDLLFFAGHSNETQITGGELGIAPNATMRISELEPKLLIAKERGLQFALFNSCKGLSLAESLVDLGLSQVAVMREPIDDRVAHVFLTQFMRTLAEYQDVHEALLASCQFLKTEANLTYPSAHLIPSLFCHPQVELFKIPRPARQRWFQPWKPKRYEAIALAGLTALSLLPSVQDFLLDRRILMQAQYRHFLRVGQSAQSAAKPPVLLVRIDDQSISKGDVKQIEPFDRNYLARLVTQLNQLNAKVIGIDYLLDYPQEGSPALAAAMRQASSTTRFVLATDNESNIWADPRPEFISAAWSVLGTIRGLPLYAMLVSPDATRLPFPYWLAWLHQCCIQNGSPSFEQLNQVATGDVDPDTTSLIHDQMRASWLTRTSERFTQMWFHPIMDYSVPLQQVFTEIPAWKLLQDPNAPELADLSQQVVLIIAGGYASNGQDPGVDAFTAPAAMTHWYTQRNPQDVNRNMVGGEYHAYMVYQTLNQRWVIPVPDPIIVLVAAGLGKATQLWYKRSVRLPLKIKLIRRQTNFLLALCGSSALYSILSLQLYLTSAVLIPIFSPVVVYWLFVAPIVIPRKS